MTHVTKLDGNTANFSRAVRAGEFVFVSGQASVDEQGRIVPGSFAEEMCRAIGNVRCILAEYNLDLSDVIKVNSYVQDPADLAEYNVLYRRHFGDPLPARTTITNCLGAAIKFEIDVVAYEGTSYTL